MVDLGGIVEAAKSDTAFPHKRGERNLGGVHRWRIGQKAPWQTHELLCMVVLGQAGRIGKHISDTVVHGAQAGGVGMAKVSYLDRKSTRLNSSHQKVSYAV